MRPPHMWEPGTFELDLAPAPERILTRAQTKGNRGPTEPLPPVIRDGNWHPTMVTAAGMLRARGFTEQAAVAALITQNSTYEGAPPPDSDEEIATLVADIYGRYPAGSLDPDQVELCRQAAEFEREFLAGTAKPTDGSKAARPRRSAAPMIISLIEFLGGSDDDANWLIDHLAARGALIVFAGLPKVGKSTFVYGLLGALTDV